MARIWFSGYHTGSTVSQKTYTTVGQLVTTEGLDMNGATIVLARDGRETKITNYDTALVDGDVVTIQKTSVKSGGFCTSREVVPAPPQPKQDIPRLMKDAANGEIVLVNRDAWSGGTVFSGTVILSKGSRELGYSGSFNGANFSPFYGKVEIEYKR